MVSPIPGIGVIGRGHWSADLSRLPVIVAAGGANPAGRVSAHHAYRRLVLDALSEPLQMKTFQSLAALMRINKNNAPLTPDQQDYILNQTLIRRIEPEYFDTEAVPVQKPFLLSAAPDDSLSVKINPKQLPNPLPPGWVVSKIDETTVKVTSDQPLRCTLHQTKKLSVSSGGQLPTGFDPTKLYPSRNHPKGLGLSVYAASDALGDLGIEWEAIKARVAPNEIGVYSGSALGQLDHNGIGGMLYASREGKRITAKQLALGLPEMPSDFVNAYVLGNVGGTGCNLGACATFLYNLHLAMEDIRSGRHRVLLVGNSEAPLVPEVIEGFQVTGALAEDATLMALDQSRTVDHRRSCRPFGENCGFTLAESGVFLVVMDDELAMETGARILGGVGGVYINADGFKKSITSPGIGNYATVGRALSTARAILGQDVLRHQTYMHAHGTGTPQNRVTESHILSEMAGAFGIENWPVAAVKSYVGHSMAPAGADQMVFSLGVWQEGIIPGITTIDRTAGDVYTKHVKFLLQHETIDPKELKGAFINSKGFGGNNATALVLSPYVVQDMLVRKHGRKAWLDYQNKLPEVIERSAAHDQAMTTGGSKLIYRFGEDVLEGKDLEISDLEIRIPGFAHPISLKPNNPYPDMC